MHKKFILFLIFSVLSSFIYSQNNQIKEIEYKFTTESEDEEGNKTNVENSFIMIQIPNKDYAIGQTEVTQSLYEAVMGDNPSSSGGDFENPPVDSVTMYDAIIFCNTLSILLEKTPVYSIDGNTDPEFLSGEFENGVLHNGTLVQDLNADGFRLPLEEEWEYAAKANCDYKYAGSNDAKEVAWFNRTSTYRTHDVATKKPNDFGLYDMSGNVWEWCWNRFEDGSLFRVYKGGSYGSDKELCEISFRGHHYPSRNQPCYSYFSFGFRIACTTNAKKL